MLKNLGHNQNDLRKFDIRQWVLVTSIQPLKVYIYKSAYLRICGQHYDINLYEDSLRHLSNFSLQKYAVNKEVFQSEAQADEEQEIQDAQDREFVMSCEEYIIKLNSEYPELKDKNISWEKTFYPQIKDIT